MVLNGGGQERFLNICVSKQILLWKLTRKDSHYIFFISRAGMEELEEISAKTGCSYRIICKKGLPFLFHRYRKRKILLAAFLFSAVSLYVMSLFSGRFRRWAAAVIRRKRFLIIWKNRESKAADDSRRFPAMRWRNRSAGIIRISPGCPVI